MVEVAVRGRDLVTKRLARCCGQDARKLRGDRLFGDARVAPALSNCAPVTRQVFIEEDDDLKAGESLDDAAKARGRLVHDELYVQDNETGPGLADEPEGVAEGAGFRHDGGTGSLGQDAAQGLPEVRRAVGDDDFSVRSGGAGVNLHVTHVPR